VESGTYYRLFLVLPASLILLGLIWHSLFFRRARFTLLFFGVGFIFFYIREFANVRIEHYQGLPQYYHPLQTIDLFGVPLPVVFGWLIVSYIGLTAAESIAARAPFWRGRIFPMFIIISLVASALAYAVEPTGIELRWWIWARQEWHEVNDPFAAYLHRTPFIALQGWSNAVLFFLIPLLLCECSELKKYGYWRYLTWLLPAVMGLGMVEYYFYFRNVFYLILLVLAVVHPLKYEAGGEGGG
jgi:hypothetical protein